MADNRLTIPIILSNLLNLFWKCKSKFSLSPIISPRYFLEEDALTLHPLKLKL